jgi:hypothetical protein
MQPDSVLPLVAAEFANLGVVDPWSITHTAIVRDRYFVGYLFRCEDLRALWFIDGGVIKFYGADRTPLRRIKLSDLAKRAA